MQWAPGEGAGFTRADYVSYWALKTGVRLSPRQHDGLVALYDGAITYTDAELGRLFDRLRADHIELEIVRVIDTPVATHLRYRIRR